MEPFLLWVGCGEGLELGKRLCFGFVDLKKAFVGVPRQVIRWAMCGLRLGGGWCQQSSLLYTGAKTAVETWKLYLENSELPCSDSCCTQMTRL